MFPRRTDTAYDSHDAHDQTADFDIQSPIRAVCKYDPRDPYTDSDKYQQTDKITDEFDSIVALLLRFCRLLLFIRRLLLRLFRFRLRGLLFLILFL